MSKLSEIQDELRDIVKQFPYYTWDEAVEHFNAEIVHDEMVDQGRWTIHSVLVFKIGDRYFEVDYEEPATEMQETDGILYEIDGMREVKPKEVTTIRYVPVTSR